MRALVLVAVLLGGCVATSQVGPFVKHVQRNGDFLVVHKCVIVLEGDDIHESACTAEQIPLRSMPMMPQQAPVMPNPPPPGAPAAPPAATR